MSSSDEWYVYQDDKVRGPLSSSELKKLATEKEIDAECLVRKGSTGSWVAAQRIKGLFTTPPPITDAQKPVVSDTPTEKKAPNPDSAHGNDELRRPQPLGNPSDTVVKEPWSAIDEKLSQFGLPSSKNRTITAWGRLLLIAGLVLVIFFFFIYDTSVAVRSSYIPGYGSVGGGRVHNMGLQQNRQLGCIAGMLMAAVGAVMIVVDNKSGSDDNAK